MKNLHQYKLDKITSCIFAGLLVLSALTGCRKSLDIGPPTTQIATNNVFTSNLTSEGVLSGLFAEMASPAGISNGGSSISIQQGLAADELTSYDPNNVGSYLFYTNALNNQYQYYWQETFAELFVCNSAINGLTASTTLTPAIQQKLLGEAKFARAFIFFNAVNLYGDVPLVLSTDPQTNGTISRSPAATVLKQVVQDLTDAQSLLPDNSYVTLSGSATTGRIIPNKQAVSALLARVYLYMQDWKDAQAQASNVIGSSIYVLEPNLSNVFLTSSRETIWALQTISPTYQNADAAFLILTTVPNGVTSQYPLSSNLVNAFETNDKRFTNWVGVLQGTPTTYYYAYKYKQNQITSGSPVTENPVLFRLAEQYLIRAEAFAQQNDVPDAQADLNVIRARAGLPPTTASTQAGILTAIYHERQIELFTEFGHRWFDLKRTGQLNTVMSVVTPEKGGVWSPYKALIPIPQSEIIINPNLTQNPGY